MICDEIMIGAVSLQHICRMVWVQLDPEKYPEHRTRLADLVHQLVNRDSLVSSTQMQKVKQKPES